MRNQNCLVVDFLRPSIPRCRTTSLLHWKGILCNKFILQRCLSSQNVHSCLHYADIGNNMICHLEVRVWKREFPLCDFFSPSTLQSMITGSVDVTFCWRMLVTHTADSTRMDSRKRISADPVALIEVLESASKWNGPRRKVRMKVQCIPHGPG